MQISLFSVNSTSYSNSKISAVRSSADICFLHVLYWYFYGFIQLGVSVTQYALIAFIYKLLSGTCSSFGSANTSSYSTILLFFILWILFSCCFVFPHFFVVEILVIWALLA